MAQVKNRKITKPVFFMSQWRDVGTKGRTRLPGKRTLLFLSPLCALRLLEQPSFQRHPQTLMLHCQIGKHSPRQRVPGDISTKWGAPQAQLPGMNADGSVMRMRVLGIS